MITFAEALAILNGVNPVTSTEKVQLQGSLGRVLAEDFTADDDVPAFDRSTMDGFACRKADLDQILRVTGEIPAGVDPSRALGSYECMRIMTGGKIPEGADYVLKKEDAEESEDGRVTSKSRPQQSNIRKKGEDLKKGAVVLPSGTFIQPQQIAVMAAGGFMNPLVHTQPAIAVLSTGNELVNPDKKPGPAQIRESNGYQLAAQATGMGLHPIYLGIVGDDKSAILNRVSEALGQYDITLLSGGVSVGDYDHVPGVLRDLGVRTLFHRMMVKPGRHLLFGVKDDHYVFGFPGNPVSSFVQFEVMIKPFIMRCMGYKSEREWLSLPLDKEYRHKPSQFVSLLPVKITVHGTVEPVEYHGSAHIHAYTLADAIMRVPAGVSILQKGEMLQVRLL